MQKESSHYAEKYAQQNAWQLERGRLLLGLANPEKGQSVLDIGCGTGELTIDLARSVSQNGKIIGIDPDAERLKIAKASTPADINNITFLERKAEEITGVESGSVDLVFSNYVFHWIADKDKVLREIMRCLRTGGRFVMECPAGIAPKIMRGVATLGKEEQEALAVIFGYMHFLDKDQWRKLLQENGFIVEHAEQLDVTQAFESLDAFHEWLEGTTHGVFKRTMFSDESMTKLREEYPGQMVYETPAFQTIVRKG